MGVRTADGHEYRGDIVIDAMGRRSNGPEWLRDVGARPPTQVAEDCGFIYYTRYFSGSLPVMVGPPLAPIGSITILRLPGDHGTWSVTIFTAAGDQALKRLRDPAAWTRVVQACPLQAPWLAGEALSEVLPMAGIMDRYRRFVVDGRPVATGYFAVADAWACTNPSAGRGLTVGFKQGVRLRDVLRGPSADPYALAEEFDEITETEIAPWFWSQIADDRARLSEIATLRGEPTAPQPSDELAGLVGDLRRFVLSDPEIARAWLEYVGTLTPIQEIINRPDVRDKLGALKQSLKDAPTPVIPGPDRGQLLELVS
jgi:flavin-dependent dehydrogenase